MGRKKKSKITNQTSSNLINESSSHLNDILNVDSSNLINNSSNRSNTGESNSRKSNVHRPNVNKSNSRKSVTNGSNINSPNVSNPNLNVESKCIEQSLIDLNIKISSRNSPVQLPKSSYALADHFSSHPIRSLIYNNLRYYGADLPGSTWLLHSGNITITNDRSHLVHSRKIDCFLTRRLKLEAIGDVYLELWNSSIVHLTNVYYSPTAKYNMISQNGLSQCAKCVLDLEEGVGYMKIEENDQSVLVTIMKEICQKYIFLTKSPSIDDVVQYAVRHAASDNFEMLCFFKKGK